MKSMSLTPICQEELLTKIQLVVEKLMHLDEPVQDNDATTSKAERSKGIIARDFGIKEWDWPQGVGLYGLNCLQHFFQDDRYHVFLSTWFDDNIRNGLPSANINTTAPYLALIDFAISTHNEKYLALCVERAHWLMNHLPRTKEGGFQHVTSAIGNRNGITLNDGELWVDTLFMAVLFLNKMGHYYNNQAWISESNKQLLIHIKYLYSTQKRLFYHGWTFNGFNNFGQIFWCRGNSWFTFGLLEFLDIASETLETGLKSFFVDTYKAQVDALCELQSENGLWHTVLDDPTSYLEVSGSAAIATGLLKGIRIGILDDSYTPYVVKAIHAICDNIASDGTVQNVSAGTGIGMNKEHYKNIILAPMAYGQSLTLIALCEALYLKVSL